MSKKLNPWIFIIGSLVVFVLLAVLYANPVLSGKQLIQPDIVHYRGGAQEMLDYRAKTHQETYWSDAMFGGMPTYQTGAQFRGDVIKKLDQVLLFLPKPANYLFLLFAGFFFLGMVALKNWKYALLGAVFFGFSTYFYIIITAGHNAKVHTIAYFAPLLASILLVYLRRKYVWGFLCATLFMGLQIQANHPQMTYYLFLGLGFLFLSELIRAYKIKEYKHFLLSSGILAAAFALGVGMNSQRILANAEYVTETVRGKQILNSGGQESGKSGIDKESLTMWSYGKLETLNLFIPRLMGGGSNEEGSDEIAQKVQELVQNNAKSQEEVNAILKGLGSFTYWGDQPMTSGPAYQGGVVIFLAILGFFFAAQRYRWWILGASALTVMLAWGHNFGLLTDFFIDYIPMYNKFRAPSSILVVVELLLPFIAILGLYQFFNGKEKTKEEKQKLLFIVTGVVVGFTLILILFGKSLLGFHTALEGQYFPPYLLDYITEARFSMFRTDALKALLYVVITAACLYLALKEKLALNVALIIIGMVSLFDLWSVDKKYLNDSNFVNKNFAQNPFLTESSQRLEEQAAQNAYIAGLLQQVPINNLLQQIAENDKEHYRVFNMALGPFNETNTSYFVNSIGGYSGAKLRRYDDLINRYFSGDYKHEILNMLNTKYVIGTDEEGHLAPQINPDTNGPAWFVSEVKPAATPDDEIKFIGEIDTKKVAVLAEKDLDYLQNKELKADSTATIELVSYQPNEIVYKTTSKTPQLAVLSEIYYPHGWKFSLDDQPTEYVKANYLLRAVYVPAGEHTIRTVFEPAVIKKGVGISLASTGLFLLLAALGFWYEKKKKPIEVA